MKKNLTSSDDRRRIFDATIDRMLALAESGLETSAAIDSAKEAALLSIIKASKMPFNLLLSNLRVICPELQDAPELDTLEALFDVTNPRRAE